MLFLIDDLGYAFLTESIHLLVYRLVREIPITWENIAII